VQDGIRQHRVGGAAEECVSSRLTTAMAGAPGKDKRPRAGEKATAGVREKEGARAERGGRATAAGGWGAGSVETTLASPTCPDDGVVGLESDEDVASRLETKSPFFLLFLQ
jgi:hypothetical protein